MQRKVDEKPKSDKEQSLLADAIKLINQLERLGINYQQMPADYGTAISKLPREKEAIVTSIYFGIEKIFVDLKVEFKYTNQQLLNLKLPDEVTAGTSPSVNINNELILKDNIAILRALISFFPKTFNRNSVTATPLAKLDLYNTYEIPSKTLLFQDRTFRQEFGISRDGYLEDDKQRFQVKDNMAKEKKQEQQRQKQQQQQEEDQERLKQRTKDFANFKTEIANTDKEKQAATSTSEQWKAILAGSSAAKTPEKTKQNLIEPEKEPKAEKRSKDAEKESINIKVHNEIGRPVNFPPQISQEELNAKKKDVKAKVINDPARDILARMVRYASEYSKRADQDSNAGTSGENSKVAEYRKLADKFSDDYHSGIFWRVVDFTLTDNRDDKTGLAKRALWKEILLLPDADRNWKTVIGYILSMRFPMAIARLPLKVLEGAFLFAEIGLNRAAMRIWRANGPTRKYPRIDFVLKSLVVFPFLVLPSYLFKIPRLLSRAFTAPFRSALEADRTGRTVGPKTGFALRLLSYATSAVLWAGAALGIGVVAAPAAAAGVPTIIAAGKTLLGWLSTAGSTIASWFGVTATPTAAIAVGSSVVGVGATASLASYVALNNVSATVAPFESPQKVANFSDTKVKKVGPSSTGGVPGTNNRGIGNGLADRGIMTAQQEAESSMSPTLTSSQKQEIQSVLPSSSPKVYTNGNPSTFVQQAPQNNGEKGASPSSSFQPGASPSKHGNNKG